MNYDELYNVAIKSQGGKPYTLARIFRKEYGENFISSWLAFLLDPMINGVGNAPLNILLGLCDKSELNDGVEVKISREFLLNKDRIDLLIEIKEEGTPTFFLAIENKILSDEGRKKDGTTQTENYYNYFSESDNFKNRETVLIYLTPFGLKPADEHFVPVSYKDFIEKLKEIKGFSDEKHRFYFKDFIEHFEHYILDDRFSEKDCEFIENCVGSDEELSSFVKNRASEERQSCFNAAIVLRNRFLNQLESKIKASVSGVWEIRRSFFYIQIYKPAWKEFGFHYEVIIHNYKGILYPGCSLLVMLHKESGDNKKRVSSKAQWRKKFGFSEENSHFNRPGWVLAEEKIKTETMFLSDNTIKKGLEEIVEKLKDLMENTASVIDEFTK